ncbi:MAG: hypothetical protein IPI16_03695 [Comamonadaceae bacterium]|nr:hypothetical protein [Comamonadaceae bacterium]
MTLSFEEFPGSLRRRRAGLCGVAASSCKASSASNRLRRCSCATPGQASRPSAQQLGGRFCPPPPPPPPEAPPPPRAELRRRGDAGGRQHVT